MMKPCPEKRTPIRSVVFQGRPSHPQMFNPIDPVTHGPNPRILPPFNSDDVYYFTDIHRNNYCVIVDDEAIYYNGERKAKDLKTMLDIYYDINNCAYCEMGNATRLIKYGFFDRQMFCYYTSQWYKVFYDRRIQYFRKLKLVNELLKEYGCVSIEEYEAKFGKVEDSVDVDVTKAILD